MLDLLRRKGFLGMEHRQREKLRNVLSDAPEDL